MVSQLTENPLGGSLQNIAKLESSAGWTKFNREIRDFLTMNGFGDLLGRNKAMPEEQGTHRSNTFEQKKEAWLDKQERACAAARSRLGYNAREEVKDKAVLDQLLLGLEKRFRPTGSAIFNNSIAGTTTLCWPNVGESLILQSSFRRLGTNCWN